jgi:hypothetical protein
VCIDDVRTTVGESVEMLILFVIFMISQLVTELWPCRLSTELDYTLTK